MKILFLISNARINKKGLTAVMIRLTLHKKRKEFSTGVFVKPSSWCPKHQKVFIHSENPEYINSQINLIKQKLSQAFLMLQIKGDPFDVDDIYTIYRGKHTKTEMGVIAVYTEHNNYYRKLVGKDLKEVSWQKFENTKGHLQGFIKWKFKQNEIKMSGLKYQFIEDFEYYLKTEQNMQQSTINKTLQRFKKMINFAIAHDYIARNPFLMHKPKFVNKEIIFLTKDELSRMEDKTIDNCRLGEVRDCFIFCCYTGLAFKEMSNLRHSNIIRRKDGNNWIRMNRQKTNKVFVIPILPVAQKLIEKYKRKLEEDRVLPWKSNAHFNAYQKEIAALCEIKVNLTQHIARKTFAVTVNLSNCVSIEKAGKRLGHQSPKTTKLYAKVLDKKVGAGIGGTLN